MDRPPSAHKGRQNFLTFGRCAPRTFASPLRSLHAETSGADQGTPYGEAGAHPLTASGKRLRELISMKLIVRTLLTVFWSVDTPADNAALMVQPRR